MAFYWTDKYKNTSAILPWLKDESNPVAIEIVFNPSSLLKKIKKYFKQFEKIRNGQDKDGEFNESISSLKRNYSSNRHITQYFLRQQTWIIYLNTKKYVSW